MFATTPYRHGQPTTWSRQRELPRLPVPTLAASLDRYVTSLKPFLLQQAKESGIDDVEHQLALRRAWARDFEQGIGRTLQERLKDIDRSSPTNWLDDHFWLKTAYHSWRAPLPVNSNWWILMANDPAIPVEISASIPPKGTYTNWQIKRAAHLIQRLVEFKVKLDREEIVPDASRAGPFCMHQYTRMFGVTRVPQETCDVLTHSPHPHPSTSIIVMANDHFYRIPVLSSSLPLTVEQLERHLAAVAKDASSREAGEGIGACSGDDRDAWTKSREYLLSLDAQNRDSITAVEDALFVLSLEDYTLESDTYTTSSPTQETPDLDAHIRSASTRDGTGRNRWWDKAITISVESNGRASMIGEHSPCDALIPSIVCDFVLAEGLRSSEDGTQRAQSDTEVDRLDWVVDDTARSAIRKAVAHTTAAANDSDGRMLWYDEYGTDWIKKEAKQSPDAYLQMALQLAFHKTHGRPTATYETASTRLFLHGRTEVIRTLSEASWSWVQAVREGNADPHHLYALLTSATTAHNSFTRDASLGKGCDRHLMALKLLMRGDESHALFEDELNGLSQSWVLSTSGLSAGDRFFGTGFGTIWPEGYGINYLAGSKLIKFGIEAKRGDSSTETFRSNLVQALREMRTICIQGQGLDSKL